MQHTYPHPFFLVFFSVFCHTAALFAQGESPFAADVWQHSSIVLTGHILGQATRYNADSSYVYAVQTLAVQGILRERECVDLSDSGTVELWRPLGATRRFDDGSIAAPTALLNSGHDFDTYYTAVFFCAQKDGLLQLYREGDAGVSVLWQQAAHQYNAVAGFDNLQFETFAQAANYLKNNGLDLNFQKNTVAAPFNYPMAFDFSTHSSKTAMLQRNAPPEEPYKEPFNFEPTTIAAGSDEVLTITAATGTDFGSLRGNVFFTNAEMGLCTKPQYTNYCDSTDILAWSPTEIKMRVPSLIVSALRNENAGTGAFVVQTHAVYNRFYYGRKALNVPYSFVNEAVSKKTTDKERFYFANYNCVRGLRFAIDTTNIYKLAARHRAPVQYCDSLITAIGAAVRQWSVLLPGVTLQIAPYFVRQPYQNDQNTRIISFVDDANNPHIEMNSYTTTRRYVTTHNAQLRSVSVRSALDINVRPALVGDRLPYWIDTMMTQDKPANVRDFYSTVLHEIGHLLGLQHTLNRPWAGSRDLMSLNSCNARSRVAATDRPALQVLNNQAVEGVHHILYDSRRIHWSTENGQVATLGSLNTPTTVPIYAQPLSKLVCNEMQPLSAVFAVAPVSATYTYEWQITGNKRTWQPIAATAPFRGQNTARLTTSSNFGAIDGKGRQFRCLVSYEGCTAYSDIATYDIGVTPAITFRPSGIYEGVNQTITLPQGKPKGGIYEGAGISGGGGFWFFNAYTAGAGEHFITYKVRNGQKLQRLLPVLCGAAVSQSLEF
jgi:hypothetical protein